MNKAIVKFSFVAATTAAICAGSAFGQGAMPPMVVGTATAKTVEHIQVRKYNGRIMALETVAVVSQVAGEIVAVHFREGADVKKDDILYTIDKVKYEAAAASARATVAQAEASASYATKTFERAKALYDKKVASDDDLDSATSAKAVADASLAAAQAALVAAEDNLAHCEIVAPIDGRIGLNKATVGNYVATASGALTTIVRQDPVRLAFSMSAREFGATYGGVAGLRDKYMVKITLADGAEYAAEPAFDFVENAANASTDTVTLYYTVPNADGALMAGMAVKVTVAAKVATQAVAVPPTAVIHSATGDFLFVMGEGGMPERRPVTTGATTATYEVIEDGLAAGETVISRGTHKVFPIPGTDKFAPVTPVAVD